MEGTEVRKLAALEDTHWWYRERRHLLGKALQGVTPGRALDIGAAGGGNTRVLRDLGWTPVAMEYGEEGAEVAHERGLATVRADARHLPLADASLSLVVAFDILEHIEEDDTGGHRDQPGAPAGRDLPRRRPGRPEAVVRPRRRRGPRPPLHARDAVVGAAPWRVRHRRDDVVERAAAAGRRDAAQEGVGQ